jgi:hypothetical protein
MGSCNAAGSPVECAISPGVKTKGSLLPEVP